MAFGGIHKELPPSEKPVLGLGTVDVGVRQLGEAHLFRDGVEVVVSPVPAVVSPGGVGQSRIDLIDVIDIGIEEPAPVSGSRDGDQLPVVEPRIDLRLAERAREETHVEVHLIVDLHSGVVAIGGRAHMADMPIHVALEVPHRNEAQEDLLEGSLLLGPLLEERLQGHDHLRQGSPRLEEPDEQVLGGVVPHGGPVVVVDDSVPDGVRHRVHNESPETFSNHFHSDRQVGHF